MESAVMEEALKELLQQQREIAAENKKEQEARQQIFIKLEDFDKKLDELKRPTANDETAVLTPTKKWFDEVKTLIERQPKTVVNQKSFQLFPNRPEEYYRLIFGNLFKGMVLLIIGIYTLVIINRYIREQEYLHYKQAWQYLYNKQNEEQKQFLEKVMKDSQNEEGPTVAKVNTERKGPLPKTSTKPH